jgi:hypothetical protein
MGKADDLATHSSLDAEFFFEFTGKCGGRYLSTLHLAARKFPFEAM